MNVENIEGSVRPCEPSIDELMRLAKHRDLTAFAQVYAQMLPVIKRQAAFAGWQDSAAEDIAHEVFLRVWKDVDRYDAQRPTRAYLLGIARNVMREFRRAGGRTVFVPEQYLPESAVEDDPAAGIERQELAQMLAAARSELSENQAATLLAVYHDGMPRRHAAIQLGCSEHAIHLRLRAALCRMRQLLSGRMRPAVLFGAIVTFVQRGFADVNWPAASPRPAQWTARWVAGIGATCLIMSSPLCPDHPSGYRPPEHEGSPTIRLSLSGEAASSPAVGVELQAQ